MNINTETATVAARHISWAHHVIEEMNQAVANGKVDMRDQLINLAYLQDRIEQLTELLGIGEVVEARRQFMAEVNSKA